MIDRWLFVFVIAAAVGLSIYAINTFSTHQDADKIKSNQDYIIKALNESEETRQANKIAILNNMTKEILSVKADAHKNREILEAFLSSRNATFTFGNTTHPNGTIMIQ